MTTALVDTGVGWLGPVPEGWDVVPARALFGERKQRSGPLDLHLTPSQKYGVLPQAEYMEITGNKVVLNLSGADNMRHVEPGDYVSHLRSFQGGLEYAGIRGKVSAAYTVLRPKSEIEPRYFKYLFKSGQYVQALQTTTDQLRDGQSIRYAQFALIPLPKPSLVDQRAIADYLDRETAQIDAFIAKNEELLALLSERRVAAIASAVTRGLERNEPLSESGVPWLGAIPASWRAVRIKFVAHSTPGYAFASESFVTDAGATRLLRGVNVGVGRIVWRDVVSVSGVSAELSGRYSLHAGDLVVGMDRPVIRDGLRIATITPNDEGTLLVQRVLRLRGHEVINAFLEYSMAWGGFASYIEPDFTGVSVPHMSEQQVGNYVIALPSLEDQVRIVEHLQTRLTEVEAARRAVTAAMRLARERRAALISAAVTGKIDVGVAA